MAQRGRRHSMSGASASRAVPLRHSAITLASCPERIHRERQRMDPKELTGRFVGAIAGFAVGDALGMPAEFLSREQIRRYYGKPISCFLKAHPGHASDFLPEGSYTDNTQMMLATAECLIECKKMDPARHADAMLSWYLNAAPHRTPSTANLRA